MVSSQENLTCQIVFQEITRDRMKQEKHITIIQMSDMQDRNCQDRINKSKVDYFTSIGAAS